MIRGRWAVGLASLALAAAALGCRSVEASREGTTVVAEAPLATGSAPASVTVPPGGAVPVPSGAAPTSPVAQHPWTMTGPVDRLEARFARPPEGFRRVPVAPGSFAAFLRALPLAPDGAKVVDYRGNPLYADGHHPNIAAVVDIDVGTQDLQQCADAVYRMHAEWRYGRGERAISYRSVSGVALPYARYLAGERAILAGGSLTLKRTSGPRADDHAFFRSYLDDVFAWAGTASLERDGRPVALGDVAGGDAFVLSGRPFGHAVLVLDVAKDDSGRLALLLGQSFMPAQSFHVLRPSPDGAWFLVEPTAAEVTTPFWRPFPVGALRRLP